MGICFRWNSVPALLPRMKLSQCMGVLLRWVILITLSVFALLTRTEKTYRQYMRELILDPLLTLSLPSLVFFKNTWKNLERTFCPVVFFLLGGIRYFYLTSVKCEVLHNSRFLSDEVTRWRRRKLWRLIFTPSDTTRRLKDVNHTYSSESGKVTSYC